MILTEHQRSIMHSVLDAIKQSHKRIVLKGSAGVGKTFLVNELIKQSRLFITDEIYVTAPTNKALSVLMEKINVRRDITFLTIHSALKLKRKFDNKTGDVYFKQEFSTKYPPFKGGCGLLVIDESSMLSSELLGYLKQYNFPILFIGDDKQLNPVGEENSPVFEQNWLTFELTEIIRQGNGNPIITLSRDIKRIWQRKYETIDPGNLGYVYTDDRPKIIDRLSEANGTDALKYLAWTNNEIDIMNMSVRKNIYGQPGMIEKGETLVFNAPYGDNFYTNQEIKIEELEILTQNFNSVPGSVTELKVYVVNEEITVVHEDSLRDFKEISKVIKRDCKTGKYEWKVYYHFIEQFADFKYNHAITVHKSQGSTYKNVVLNVGNLNRNPKREEKQRLFYTGITRASDLLILYNV